MAPAPVVFTACALISAPCMIEMVGALSVTPSAFFWETLEAFRKRVSMIPPASMMIELLADIVNVVELAAARMRLAMVALLTNPALPELLSPVGPTMTLSWSEPIPTVLA